MRILFVVHGYPPSGLGGTEVHTWAAAHELATRGHGVSVFAARAPATAAVPEHGIENDGPVEVHWVDRVTDGRLWDDHVRNRFDRLLSESRPDVVHVQHLHQLSADLIEVARSHAVPTIVSLHDLWFQCSSIHPGPKDRHPITGRAWGLACAWHEQLRHPRRVASLIRRRRLGGTITAAFRRPNALRRQLDLADLAVAPSRFMHESFVRFGVPPSKLRLLPLGTPIKRDGRRRQAGPHVRFGFAGTIAPSKGVHLLCEAFSHLGGKSTLWIYGPASDAEYLRSIAAYEGPKVRYMGPFHPSRAMPVYQTFDVLVVPSLVAESFNLSALDAQASGLPVIASDIGALPERVSHGRNGILVPAGDVRALHRAMAALEDPGEVRRLAAGVPRRSSMVSYVMELEAMYGQLTGGGSPSIDQKSRSKELSLHG